MQSTSARHVFEEARRVLASRACPPGKAAPLAEEQPRTREEHAIVPIPGRRPGRHALGILASALL